jgi:hypothetical protein
MTSLLRWLWLLAGLAACAQPPAWQVRELPGCAQPLSDLQLERERGYLAALLALNARGYAIWRAELPQIVAEVGPFKARSHFEVRVREDGQLELDAPGALADRRTVNRYEKLRQTTATFRCRELEWLRWEAQNRGLAPVGSGAIVEGVPASPGKEMLVPRGADHEARLLQLYDQRARLHLGRKITLATVSAGVVGTGVTILFESLFMSASGCEDDDSYGYTTRDCSSKEAAKILAIVGGGLTALGGMMLGGAVPWLVQTMRRHHDLGRQIRALRDTQLSVGPGGAFGLSWRRSF